MKERDFVEFLRKQFGFTGTLGIGDDTSVEKEGNRYRLTTKDVLVEGVHFTRNIYSMQEIAMRSLAVNVSDIAAMGGVPDKFYIGLGFPEVLGDDDLKAFYEGIGKGCDKWGIQLGGGDFSRARELFVSITMTGYTENPVYRSGAEPGDIVCVSGTLGSSSLGLQLIQKGLVNEKYLNLHKIVEPEINLGAKIAPYVSSMMDLSDGLMLDLQRIADASGTGAEIDYNAIPVESDYNRICGDNDIDCYSSVLAGGEDFRLLFTVPEEKLDVVRKITDYCYPVGIVNSEAGCVKVISSGKEIYLKKRGYDHFSG